MGPLDRYAPNDPLLRGASAGLLWLLGITGLLTIIADPVAALFIGPFVILSVVFSIQLALSAYRGDAENSRSVDEIDGIPEDASDAAFATLRERYASGEIDHEEFERRVANLLDADAVFDEIPDDREAVTAVERE